MKFYSVDEIQIPLRRQRQQFDPAALNELADSIATRGLDHAVVVREDNGSPTLVSGHRRLKAISQLADLGIPFEFDLKLVEAGKIPTTTKGELSFLEAWEAELSENIDRENLTWQERASAESELHELRIQQAAAAGKTQSIEATASELDGEVSAAAKRLSKSRIVAKHMNNPEVAKAKTLDEALKVVEKGVVAEHRQRLAIELGPSLRASRHTLLQGDYRTPAFGPVFDVLITDPPYNVGADKFGEQGSKDRQYEDKLDFAEFAKWSILATKPESHAYVFCSYECFSLLEIKMMFAGWSVWPRPLIWSKGNGVLPVHDGGPRYTYECILFARRGSKKVLQVGNDVLNFSSPATTGHPDQKPVDLFVELLRRSCLPGDKVLDPFAGSGTIFPAANKLMLTATGIELSPQYYTIAAARMESKE